MKRRKHWVDYFKSISKNNVERFFLSKYIYIYIYIEIFEPHSLIA